MFFERQWKFLQCARGSSRFCILAVCSVLLTGCVSRPAPLTDGWRLKGRVGIKTTDDAVSFSLVWLQQGQSFDIRLNGTLGIPVAHIVGGSERVTIDVPREGRFEADSASELLLRHTGLSLPIESLIYWVRGVPDPSADFEFNDTTLIQRGWKADYLEFKGDNPVKMRFTRPGIRILLVVSSWG